MSEKAAVLDEALTGLPTYLLQVPRAWSADRASDAIVAKLDTVTTGLGSTALGPTALGPTALGPTALGPTGGAMR
jgi:hypothetical protein